MLGLRSLDRRLVFEALRERGLGVNVHYIPVHLQPYYQGNFACKPGDFPVAEAYYQGAVTLPLFPAMIDDDVHYVIDAVLATIREMMT